jgi:hypothetical protein
MFLMVTHCEPERASACDAVVEQINKSYELIDPSSRSKRMFQRNIIPRTTVAAPAAQRLKLLMHYDELQCDRIGR